jgi:hypothetical protein
VRLNSVNTFWCCLHHHDNQLKTNVDSCYIADSRKRFAVEVQVSCDEVEYRFLKCFAAKYQAFHILRVGVRQEGCIMRY